MVFQQGENFRLVRLFTKDRGQLRGNRHKPGFEVYQHISHNGFDVLRRVKLIFFQLQFVLFVFALRPNQLRPLRVVIYGFVALRVSLSEVVNIAVVRVDQVIQAGANLRYHFFVAQLPDAPF